MTAPLTSLARTALLVLALPLAAHAVESEATPPATRCAPAPALALAPGFGDRHGAFAPAAPAFRRTQANFATAYSRACARGLLRRRPLIVRGAGQGDMLRLKNAPDANIASIYLDGEEGTRRAARHMVLEYPFLTADGATHVPSTSELAEAIFCTVHGASQQEEEASGRCLPD